MQTFLYESNGSNMKYCINIVTTTVQLYQLYYIILYYIILYYIILHYIISYGLRFLQGNTL